MARRQQLSNEEISAAFHGEWGEKFPPVLSILLCAQLLLVSPHTVKRLHANGRFAGCTTKVGKHRRFWRDRVIAKFFNSSDDCAAGLRVTS